MKTVLKIPDSYVDKVKKYCMVDFLLAILLFFMYCLAMVISGVINKYVSNFEITVIGGVVNICFVLIVFAFLSVRKQGIDTIGLKAGNIKLSLVMGLVLSAILFFCNCLSNIIFEGQQFLPIDKIVVNIFYFFTVGLSEEVMFRGYIGTRLCGLIDNVYVATLLTGLLFVLMHFPFRMVAYHMTFMELAANSVYMTDLFVTHLILSFIRIKSDSLYGAILPHWISDLSYSIVTHIS